MSGTHTHPHEGEWMAWIEGQLPPDDSARLSAHCRDCLLCSRVVTDLRRAAAASYQTHALPAAFAREAKAEFMAALPATLRGIQANAHSLTSHSATAGLHRHLPNAVLTASSVYLLVTVAAWALWISSGEWSYASSAFGLPYKTFLAFAAASAAAFDYISLRQFEPRHRLHTAWSLFLVASACRLGGTFASAIPAYFPDGRLTTLVSAGEFIAGPVSLAALFFGLLHAYRAYQEAGMSASLKLQDWLILGAGALFTARHMAEVAGIVLSGNSKPPMVMLNWLADPVLLFVLAAAVPLRRTALAHNNNLVARCWSAMAAGAMLIFAGNFLQFLGNYGYLTWPISSIVWLVWIPAYSALTLGPAYQLAANGEVAVQPALASNPR